MRAAAFLTLGFLVGISHSAEQPVEFNRDVRPILADHCFACHGPDARQRQAELRLDTGESADPKRQASGVVVAGKPEASELFLRVSSSDPDVRMPPPDKGGRLTAAEIATLRQWIADGGRWQKHWSLIPVTRPKLPQTRHLESARSGLDTFILARLQKEGLAPSPEADRPTSLRRVTLALTGLPPTPEEIEAFLADNSPDAYERHVDRLLASPRYGERMAVPWLDAARYADTSGYQSDGERIMWRWRDWVIEALNANMPFDQFTIEQIAGDLLPEATLEQKIATGFSRNHRGNAEGGIIPEEYAVEYVADRVETTATVWLGLTLGCCRCHDHKYDPFSQRDFYRLFAFFNNVPEKGRAIKIGNSPPFIQTPTRLQQERLDELTMSAEQAESHWREFDRSKLAAAQAEWLKSFSPAGDLDWHPDADLVAAPAERFDGQTPIEAGDIGNFGFFDRFTLAAWVQFPAGGGGTIVSRMTDVEQGDGYQLAIVGGKLQLNLVKRWLDDSLRVETEHALPPGQWHHVLAVYDGSRVADGVSLFVDGRLAAMNVLLDELNQSFATKQPLRIGGGGGEQMRFRGQIDGVRIYRDFSDELLTLATRESIAAIVAAESPSKAAAEKLTAYFLREHAPAEMRRAYEERLKSARQLRDYSAKLPTTMVMQELPQPRPAHILIRGQYDMPGERVGSGVPGELPPLPDGMPANRLALARWLVDPANPLTARVAVNRAWQLHFGVGLVKTAEDFGRQGEWPSHPELLDWLAAEFQWGRVQGSGFRVQEPVGRWDVKRLHRLIVTSSIFRQSSAVSPAVYARDPENRLLARGPRLRLSAEMVRDQALFAGGQLVEQVGGPSVRPLQPAGLWSELTGGEDYQPGSGSELVRRSLYTFWKRTIPPPALSTFDAPTREFCSVRESRTNTPLQALVLLNEPTLVAASRALAERVIREAESPDERIARAMLYVVNRRPTNEEARILRAALQRHSTPHAPREAGISRSEMRTMDELAAYALVCSTILNLDEAVTRQ
jgi:mono/diheme cytochrome c family protein